MTATPKATGAVRVKPLVWKDATGHFAGSGWDADSPFGQYYIFEGDEDDLFRWGNLVTTYDQTDVGRGEYLTLESAQAAAQSDYEARILSALEPAPDAIRAAAEGLAGAWAEFDKPLLQFGSFNKMREQARTALAAWAAANPPTEGGA